MLLSACTTTDTTPVAPDTFKLDTNAQRLLFTGSAGADILLKAVQITQQAGYTHFTIVDGSSGSGSQYAGTTGSVYGGGFFAAPIYSPTASVSAIVKMSNTLSPGAWTAADVIAKKGKMFAGQ